MAEKEEEKRRLAAKKQKKADRDFHNGANDLIQQANDLLKSPPMKSGIVHAKRTHPEPSNTTNDQKSVDEIPPITPPNPKRVRSEDDVPTRRIAHIPKVHPKNELPLTPATSPQTSKRSPIVDILKNSRANSHEFILDTLLTPTSNSPTEEVRAPSIERIISTIIGWDPNDLKNKNIRYHFPYTPMCNFEGRDIFEKYVALFFTL